jgi:hypothetical protein
MSVSTVMPMYGTQTVFCLRTLVDPEYLPLPLYTSKTKDEIKRATRFVSKRLKGNRV